MTRMRGTQLGDDRRAEKRHGGFTMVELLVVIAIIALLVSMVVVVAGRVRGSAEKTSTQHLMSAIKTGLTSFKEDLGYYPPLLTDDLTVPDANNLKIFQQRRQMQYWSTLTLVPYLVGMGDLNLNTQTTDDEQDDGYAGAGFRDPGVDKSWGGTIVATDRVTYFSNIKDKQGSVSGRVYGPYIELGGEFDVTGAEDRSGAQMAGLFQFNDYWERPIRYYTGWQKDPGYEQEEELFVGNMFTEWVATVPVDQQANFKSQLRSASFVLFSEGEDRQFDADDAVADTNKDNLVEVGT